MKCEKEKIKYEDALVWAWDLFNKKDGTHYWRGKLTTLTQLYHKILPAYVDFTKQNKNMADYAAIRKAAMEKTKIA